MMEFMDMHEGTGEVLKYLDDPLVMTLQEMNLDDTIVILVSDHGWHMKSIFHLLKLEITKVEINLPALFIMLP